MLKVEPIVANAKKNPCASDSAGLLKSTTLGPVTISVLTAKTTKSSSGARAESSVAKLRIGLGGLLGITVIDAEVLSTKAAVNCSPSGSPVLSSSSTIAKLKINGQSVVNLDQEASLGILIGTIHLNERVTTANSVTRRALHVSALGLVDVVVAESIAGVSGGNPCAPVPQCRDKADNDNDHKTDYPADPGCTGPDDDDEKDPKPKPQCSDGEDNDGDYKTDYPADPGCTGPDDDDETDVKPAPQCSDGIDNDRDKKTDKDDPGCHTDGDPKNDSSYNPKDFNENDVKQCSDTGDNDNDYMTDKKDPDCHSDHDAGNDASYDPADNDEKS